MQLLDEAAVATVLRFADLIPAMRRALIDYSAGRIAQPQRRIIEVESRGGFFASMAAASATAVGAKLVTVYPGNAERGLHTHLATIVLLRPETGEPLVVMDGRLITEMRTAAVTAAFVDAVAAPDVRALAILGAGIQGRSHIAALRHVRDFKEIRIWNRTPERAERLAQVTGGKAMSRESAVRGADVVVVATSAVEPVLEGKWLKPGAKVATVGWGSRDGTEVDADTMASVVIVDSREGALAESGNFRKWRPVIHAELGEVLDGRRPVDPRATVVFVSLGMACEDIAAAALVYERLSAKSGGPS